MKNHLISLALLTGAGLLHPPLTAMALPVATTTTATSIGQTNATINGSVNPNGALAAAYFQYGLTTNYGNIGGFISLPATNTAQTLAGLVVNELTGAAGASWRLAAAPGFPYLAIASSADGSRLAVGVNGGGIYVSTNSGSTWTLTSAPSEVWVSIASSADGTRLAAAIGQSSSGLIYASTNGGATWALTGAPFGNWTSIVSSADGIRLAAVIKGGGVYTSTNAGGTWTGTSAPAANWYSIASSVDGTRLAAAADYIYTSTNGGATWTQTGATNGQWQCIASSSDGLRLVAANDNIGIGIYVSTNGGSTWAGTSAPNLGWQSVASSADGTQLAVVTPSFGTMANGAVYTSTNSGLTWIGPSGDPNTVWTYIAMSADGSKMAGAANGVYTSTGPVSPLAPGTTYHYRAVGVNSLGTALGADLTFSTLAQPAVTTSPATSITSTSATLNGTVNPNGAATTAYFRYGLTTSYGSFSATNSLAATNATLSVSDLVGNLTPGTTYHFQLVASNSLGTVLGGDDSLTTLAQPAATTSAATAVTTTNATLNGTVNPNLAATLAYFRYGLTTSYGFFSATNALPATNVALPASNLISNLTPGGTTYHFQLVAGNSVGTNAGADLTFTTGATLPAVTTLAAGGITATNAILNGMVNPNGATTTAYFKYGLTTSYGSYSATNTLTATNSTLSVPNLTGSLTPGTTYHFQLVAGNSVGANTGADLTFTTGAAVPAVTTLAASGITATKATFNGTINPNGAATTAYFQYGLTTSYGNYSATNPLTATNVTLSVTNLISSLAPGVTYHFQLVAGNSAGANTGADLTFTTGAAVPAVTTVAASSITATNATFNGTVNPNGAGTSAYFQFGPTTSYGDIASLTALPATNSTLNVAASPGGVLGTNWTQTGASSAEWYTIASSADGTRLVSAVNNGGIYTSTNRGVTWTLTSAPASGVIWDAIVCSSDGTRLAAVTSGGGIYTSANSGSTWTLTSAPGDFWSDIASSADGTRLAAVVDGAGIYTSADSGATWILTSAPFLNWTSIASSADGARLTAGVNNGGIYTSTNSGVTWTLTSAPSQVWIRTASSADGTKLAGAVYGGGIYTSTNSGSTWTLTSALSGNWNDIVSSADGTRLAAVLSGAIYASTNSGATWTQTSAPNLNWIAIACSADGRLLAADAYNTGIFISTGAPLLTPGTTYHYRLVAANSLGTSFGNDLTFTTVAVAPTAITLAASSITPTNATLNGTVNPNGAAASAYFQYGLTTNYGSFSATNSVAATNVTLSMSNLTSGLAPGSTYHFQLVASNSAGTSSSADLTFTTGTAAPAVSTLTASGVTATNAIINGTVNPNGAAATVYFQYGLTTSYGSYSATNTLTATNVAQSVTNLISGLMPGTIYHFQLVASNSVGANVGADVVFTTGSGIPVATTLAATGMTATNAALNGSVNPNGAATSAYFRYGLTTNYGGYSATNTLAATNVIVSVSNLVVSLTPGTTYHFQLVASNSVGISLGNDLTFATVAGTPTATTLAASAITATNANLNGTVNPNAAATSAYFRYGLTTGYGSYSATNSLAATNATLSVSNLIGGLAPGTTYHFQLVASNGAGTSMGSDLTFTTGAAMPAATTQAASGVNSTNATLNGTVNPDGAATSAYFRYGLTTGYGSYSATNSLAATNVALSVSDLIKSLAPGTTYHFQLVAGNSVGTNAGADLTFTTSVAIPTATTLAASGVNATNATLNGTVNPNGAAATVYFQYGVTTNYGSFSATNTLAATNLALSVPSLISGLAPGATYHFRLLANNSVGTNAGADLTFTTSAAVPTVATLVASGVNATNATLNGTVNPNGATSTAYFRYGLTTNYGSYSATNSLAATNIILSVSNLISNLTPGTAWHFQLVAGNSAGTSVGNDLTFSTTSSQAVAFSLSGPAVSPGGAFQFSFTNLSGLSFTVLGATNLALPLSNWTVLGVAAEGPSGQYQFTDPQATNSAILFYRVRSP